VLEALQQYDPYCGAHVLSRGIVGSRGEVPTVASPMYKQVFDLRTGQCLDAVSREPVDVAAYPVRVLEDVVFVGREPLPAHRAS
jgi:nitrite reductase (NADH) small subunit